MSSAGHQQGRHGTDAERAAANFGAEVITNAAGERMSAAKIEARLKASSPLIGQAVCIGDKRPYNVALILLDPRERASYASMHGLDDASLATLADDERVQDAVALGIDLANEQLSGPEQIKRFAILPVDWRPGSDELTPSRKLKRKPIAAKYAEKIDWMYTTGGPERS
jgi:long-subunit acyl-CoA synthetase (AMP-forming)